MRATKSMGYVPGLDGIRGIAILGVMLFHFGLVEMGWMGVEFFFVLSGYLITRILSRGKSWPLGFYLKRFYWRRTLRIFPLYFGFLLLLLPGYGLTGHPSGLGEFLPYLATYTFNIAMLSIEWTQHTFYHYLWSLSFEEQFYLIWPITVFLLSRRGLRNLCLGLMLVSPGIRYLLAEYLIEARGTADLVGGMVYYFPAGQLDTFATGGLLAVVPWEQYIRRPQRWWAGLAGLFLAVGMVNLAWHLTANPDFALTNLGYPVASLAHGQHIWGHSLINLTAAGLIILAAHPDAAARGFLGRALEARGLVQLGKISYGVYIIHWPLQMLLEKIFPLQTALPLRWLQFFPFLAVVVGLAWVIFHYYESWFLAQKTARFHPPPGESAPARSAPEGRF
ncbi:MAG: acyltransferase [Bacteroidota bacterium]